MAQESLVRGNFAAQSCNVRLEIYEELSGNHAAEERAHMACVRDSRVDGCNGQRKGIHSNSFRIVDIAEATDHNSFPTVGFRTALQFSIFPL
jgi:hypothetical protein